MSASATPLNASGVVEWNDLGEVAGDTATFSPFLWRPFPILLEGPFSNEVLIRCRQNWEPSSQFLSWWLLQLVLTTSQGLLELNPAEKVYPSDQVKLVSFQIPLGLSSIGWNTAQLRIKGRAFNSPRFVPSATRWRVAAEQGIVRERLIPLQPQLIRRTQDLLQEFIITERGEAVLVPDQP